MRFYTTHGEVEFCVHDIAGGAPVRGHADADAAVLMFDITQRNTYDSLPLWHDEMVRPGIPAVLVGNKCDARTRKVKPASITFHREKGMHYYDISAKSNYQFEKPFVWLLRRLVDPNLVLAEAPTLAPVEIHIDDEHRRAIEQENAEAAAMELPEEEGDDF